MHTVIAKLSCTHCRLVVSLCDTLARCATQWASLIVEPYAYCGALHEGRQSL